MLRSFDSLKVLDSVNVELEKKSTIALVESAKAVRVKTTLANMIAGLIRPDSGELFIDGIPYGSV